METLEQKQKWTLDQKVFHLFEVFGTYYNYFNGQVYLSFSGGKDSTVLMYFIKKWLKMNNLPPIKYVFNNTTNEHKEILDFVKSFGDEITHLRPKMTFAQTVAKYGFPMVSKQTARFLSRYKNTKSEQMRQFYKYGTNKDGSQSKFKIANKWHHLIEAPFNFTDKCCDILKKEPVHRFEKETGLKPVIGTMADEGNLRKIAYKKNGEQCNVFTEGKEQCKPLSIFTEKDIWDLIKIHNIEICSIYYDQIINGELVKGEKRTGCKLCGFGCQYEQEDEDNRYIKLSKREPNVHKSFMDKLGYREVLEFMGIKPE